MNKIGILGLIGKAESMIKSFKTDESIDIVGIYDPDFSRARKIAETNDIPFNANPFGIIIRSL